jgi:YidC/Oxa1 family membrane protein insertase
MIRKCSTSTRLLASSFSKGGRSSRFNGSSFASSYSINATTTRNFGSFFNFSSACDDSSSQSPIRIGPSSDAATTSAAGDNITVSIDNAIASVDPVVVEVLGNGPTHLVMKFIDFVHIAGDIPYWGAIIASTILLRTVLLPITISGIQNSARLQIMKPEMEKIQKAFTSDPLKSDVRSKKKYEEEMKGLFKKYNCNPIRSLSMPLLQIPIFMSFFFALREMGTFFPDFATGGALWFTDLTVADASYALPIINALSFLGMLELTTATNNQLPNKQLMKNVMRVLAVAMIPMTMDMPQAVFMYWSANSSFSVVQMLTLKVPVVKKWLDIPDPPVIDQSNEKPMENPFKGLMDAAKKAAEERKRAQSGTPEFIPTQRASTTPAVEAKKEAEKPKQPEAIPEAPKGPTFSVHPRFKKKN